MMKHNVAVLEGTLLDAAVAKAEGIEGARVEIKGNEFRELVFSPSTNWDQGGPIIQRERICLLQYDDIPGYAVAFVGADVAGGAIIGQRASADGTTPLIAAMRAYVISKVGEQVDLP